MHISSKCSRLKYCLSTKSTPAVDTCLYLVAKV